MGLVCRRRCWLWAAEGMSAGWLGSGKGWFEVQLWGAVIGNLVPM